MKRLLILSFVALFTFVIAAAAEDLGELAKKEKARREALEKSGKQAKTLTNADVANIKSQLAIQKPSDTQTAPASDATGATAGDANQPQTAESKEDQAKEQQRQALEQQKQEIQQKIEDLQAQKQAAQQEVDQARNAVGSAGIYHSANVGNQYQTVDAQEQKVQELDKQISDLNKQLQDLEQQDQQQ